MKTRHGIKHSRPGDRWQMCREIGAGSFSARLAKHRNNILLSFRLEDTARYGGLLLPPAKGFWPLAEVFFALRAKNELIMLFWPIYGLFWGPKKIIKKKKKIIIKKYHKSTKKTQELSKIV